MRKQRIIYHIDGNNFFASCECLRDPTLKEVPMAVAGDPKSRHGIILAKNQLAKNQGVQTAETIWQAQRKCPGLVLVPPHKDLYQRVSQDMNRIFQRYTDLVEPASVDESYLDVTGSLHLFGRDPVSLADRIRVEVKTEIGITVSVGVSFCKTFAKLGSDYKKPDATTRFLEQDIREKVWPLPVGDMMYVGGKFANQLAECGIRTIGELALSDEKFIHERFGVRGDYARNCARGLDREVVRPYFEERETKSIGNSITFQRNLTGERDIRLGFTVLAESVAERMRKHGVHAGTVQIQIKDPQFHTITRQESLEKSVWLADDLLKAAMRLAGRNWDWNMPVRLLGLSVDHLIAADEDQMQFSLFESESKDRDRKGRLEDAMSVIRAKYGKQSIHLAGFLNNDIGIGAGGEPEDSTEQSE